MDKNISKSNQLPSRGEGLGVGSPLVSIIMGSTSDLPVMEKACKLLDELQVPLK